METEKQRITIAEACGFRIAPDEKYEWVVTNPDGFQIAWSRMGGKPTANPASYFLPDFLNDLNAMAEAVKVLDYDQAEQFESDLWSIAYEVEKNQEYPRPANFACINASAEQRAEAFLKALNLWPYEPKPEPEIDCLKCGTMGISLDTCKICGELITPF